MSPQRGSPLGRTGTPAHTSEVVRHQGFFLPLDCVGHPGEASGLCRELTKAPEPLSIKDRGTRVFTAASGKAEPGLSSLAMSWPCRSSFPSQVQKRAFRLARTRSEVTKAWVQFSSSLSSKVDPRLLTAWRDCRCGGECASSTGPS